MLQRTSVQAQERTTNGAPPRTAAKRGWRPTVAVDFDGVIRDCHERPGDPWRPVTGAGGGLRRLSDMGFRILIYSSRDEDPIRRFMDRFHLPYDEIRAGQDNKPLFTALIDDRAIPFDGDWTRTTQRLQRFKPYWRA